MKNISRIVEIIVALSLGTAMITSCTSNRKNSRIDVITTESTTEQIEMTTIETATDEEMTTTETTTRTEIPTRFPKEKMSGMPTIEEQVLLDNDMVKITAKELIVYRHHETCIRLYVENKSEKAFDLKGDDVIINGYVCYSLSKLSLKAGEKADFELGFRPESYNERVLGKIGEIKLRFCLREPDSFYDVIQKSDWITINASDIEAEDEKLDKDGITLFDKDGIRIVAIENGGFDLESASIKVYIENNTDKDIYIEDKDFYVNGYRVDGDAFGSIYAGTKMITSIEFFYYDNPDKEEIGIIDELGVSFEIKDNNDKDTILMNTDMAYFNAKELRYYDDCLQSCYSNYSFP